MTFVGNHEEFQKSCPAEKESHVAIATWSGKEFSDPYIEMKAKGEVHEDLQPRENTGTDVEQYFKLWITRLRCPGLYRFKIVYHGKNMMMRKSGRDDPSFSRARQQPYQY